MKQLIRAKHNCGKGLVWYILDTETGYRKNTFYGADVKDGYRKSQMQKLFKEELDR